VLVTVLEVLDSPEVIRPLFQEANVERAATGIETRVMVMEITTLLRVRVQMGI